ncbi:hypothetical protein FRC17_004672 [Serendipita sp. 399]|nr:hypothetical protein FRC17_004672 [Serendipita sp. 399]
MQPPVELDPDPGVDPGGMNNEMELGDHSERNAIDIQNNHVYLNNECLEPNIYVGYPFKLPGALLNALQESGLIYSPVMSLPCSSPSSNNRNFHDLNHLYHPDEPRSVHDDHSKPNTYDSDMSFSLLPFTSNSFPASNYQQPNTFYPNGVLHDPSPSPWGSSVSLRNFHSVGPWDRITPSMFQSMPPFGPASFSSSFSGFQNVPYEQEPYPPAYYQQSLHPPANGMGSGPSDPHWQAKLRPSPCPQVSGRDPQYTIQIPETFHELSDHPGSSPVIGGATHVSPSPSCMTSSDSAAHTNPEILINKNSIGDSERKRVLQLKEVPASLNPYYKNHEPGSPIPQEQCLQLAKDTGCAPGRPSKDVDNALQSIARDIWTTVPIVVTNVVNLIYVLKTTELERTTLSTSKPAQFDELRSQD